MNRGMMAALLLVLAGGVRAEGMQQGFDLGGGLFYTHMDELPGGHALVTEKGPMLEGVGRLFQRQNGLELGASLSLAEGTINYYGASQDRVTLASQPYNTTTATTMAELKLDASLLLGRWRLKTFAGYGLWLREVQSKDNVSGATEDYRWLTPGLGLGYRYPLADGMALEPALDVWGTLRVRQAAADGLHDTVHLHPGSRAGARLSLTVERPLQNQLTLHLQPWLQVFSFGQSEYVPTTTNGQQQYVNSHPEVSYQPPIRYVQAGLTVTVEGFMP